MQRLARRLARDASEADDLVQQTWLRAILSPPRHGRSLRGWLAGVVRNVARNGRESARRRSEYELRSFEERRSSSPVEIVAHGGLRRRMARALQALPDDYRHVLRLRYYEDLGPPEIARSLDLPLETVRTRLKRGRDRLRTSLEQRGLAERIALALLLPFGPGRLRPEGWRPGGTARGVPGILIAEVLVCVVGLMTVLQLTPTAATTHVAAGPELGAADAAGRRVASLHSNGPIGARRVIDARGEREVDPLAEDEAVEATPAEAAPSGQLLVRVVDANGELVPDAEVRLSEPRQPRVDRAVGRTDWSGRLEIASATAGAWVSVRGEGRHPSLLTLVRASDLDRSEVELVLAAKNVGPVTVRVEGPNGTPVQGAVVEFASTPLQPNLYADGTVVLGLPTRTVAADSAGRLALPPLPLTRCDLLVRAPGFAPAQVSHHCARAAKERRSDTDELVVTLAPEELRTATRLLTGYAVDAAGAPLPGRVVALQPHSKPASPLQFAMASGPGQRRAVTDARGGFAFDDCADEPHDLRLLPSDEQDPVSAAATTVLRPGADSVALVESRTRSARVHGLLTSADGQPLERGLAILTSSTLVRPLDHWLSAGAGFAFEGLPPGSYALSVVVDDALHVDIAHFELGAKLALELGQVALAPLGSIRADLVWAEGTVPAPTRAKLSPADPTVRGLPGRARLVQCTADAVHLQGVFPGDYTLTVQAIGAAPWSTLVRVDEGAEVVLAGRMERGLACAIEVSSSLPYSLESKNSLVIVDDTDRVVSHRYLTPGFDPVKRVNMRLCPGRYTARADLGAHTASQPFVIPASIDSSYPVLVSLD